MAEDPKTTNPDWNQGGQPEVEKARSGEREHRSRPPENTTQQTTSKREGRDEPPPRPEGTNTPWLGGG